MSCLVIIAVQESNGSLVGGEDLGVSLEDTGLTSSAMDTLNVIQSLSSSTSSLNDSSVDRRARMDPASDLSRRQHDPSSSPYILFSRSHDPDDDMIRSSTGPAAKASSKLSQSLADAFGSELASAGGSSEKPPTRGHSSSSGSSNSGRSSNNNNNNNNNNRIKKIINAGLQRPTADESDLELWTAVDWHVHGVLLHGVHASRIRILAGDESSRPREPEPGPEPSKQPSPHSDDDDDACELRWHDTVIIIIRNQKA
ncbi:hypothetical protein BGZ67_000483 [Mortierella alpina]|nr:hypothetical protein BGZ67_000483 [Mortierella alpina]